MTEKMVLQGRIELPTSPLPRECSTTELLQLTQSVCGGSLAPILRWCKRNLDPFFRLG